MNISCRKGASLLLGIVVFFSPTLSHAAVPPVPGTILSASPETSWEPGSWDGNFYSYQIDLNSPQYLKQQGVVTDVEMMLGYYSNQPNRLISFYIKGPGGSTLDCKTTEKTVTDWGIYNNSQGTHFNEVHVGPFTGTQCDMRGQSSFTLTAINAPELFAPAEQISSVAYIPFIAYSADIPNAIKITTDVSSNQILHTGQVYVVSGEVQIPQGITVQAEPGAIVKFDNHSSFLVNGSLVAEGSTSSPAFFTSFKDDSVGGDTNADADATSPNPGDWDSIIADPDLVGGTVSLDHASIGFGSNTMLYDNGGLTIHNSSITHAARGIFNAHGSTRITPAENNWWGSATGPQNGGNANGAGIPVSDFVSYAPWLTSDPFGPAATSSCSQNCNSNVLFLPGIEGSILKDGDTTLWPPALGHVNASLGALSFNSDGSPVNSNITVAGITNTFDFNSPNGNLLYSFPVYKNFSTFMDSLTSSINGTSVIQAWKPLAYDWRRSPEDIVANGIKINSGTVSPVTEVEVLAASSRTGKVTIIAHSYGGLVGKTLIKALEDKGEANLVDNFIMVASPQLGTPQTIGGLLHGEGSTIGGSIGSFGFYLVNKTQARTLAQNLPSAYELLPSTQYFSNVLSPTVVFDASTPLTALWRDLFGDSISNSSALENFLTSNDSLRVLPNSGDTEHPVVASPALIAQASNSHSTYDTFGFPPNVHVVQIAGWGLNTIKDIKYTEDKDNFDYQPEFTTEGDNTVVYPSVVSTNSSSNYYFNLSLYNSTNQKVGHSDLMGAFPVTNLLKLLITNADISDSQYVGTSKPPISDSDNKLLVAVHSPMTIGAHDSQGHFTGIAQNQDPNADIQFVTTDIPNSEYVPYGDGKYILLPQGDTYTFSFQGSGTGPAAIDIQQISNDVQTSVATYPDIQISTSTSATLTIQLDLTQLSNLQIDQNGDGQTDTYVAPNGGALSLSELITNLTTAVNNSSTKDKLKAQLLNKAQTLQNKIAKQAQKQSKILAQLQTQVSKQSGKGKIDATTAASLSSLLDSLIASEATVPLDPALLQQLSDQITAASITQSLKTSLLNKIFKLSNILGIEKSLENFTKTVTTKGVKGILSDTDMQTLLNLLEQIQNTL